jgi:TonB-linked SusC/RagA family outer membrane protein
MRFLLSAFFVLILYAIAYSQEKQISGKVIHAKDNQPLPGVNVLIKGTSRGTTTSSEGTYALTVQPDDKILIFSYIGMQTQEIPVTATNLDVSLSESSSSLNEVLVVAYGTANRTSYTGSASVVNAGDIQKQQISSVSRALQGVVPGVQAVASAGQPGSDATIRIRGIGSINASSDPLYVVDGVPYTGNVNTLNPVDIQSITVLKDASASALYGSRGANGVIIITTKQGKFDAKPTVSISASTGVSTRAVADYEKVNAKEYFELQWEALRNKELNKGRSLPQAAQYATDNVVSTLKINPFGLDYPNPVGLDGKIVPGAEPLWEEDWGKSVERTGVRRQVDVNISGGGAHSKYFISGGYLKDKGFIIGSEFTRYNSRVNFFTQVNRWLEAGLNIAAATTNQDAPPQTDSQQGNFPNFGRIVPGIYPIYERNADGSLKLDAEGKPVYDFGNYRPSAAATGNNLLGSASLNKYQTKADNAIIRANTIVTLLEGLKIKSSLNADYSNRLEHSYTNPQFGGGVSTKGSVSKGETRTFAYTINNFLDYTTRFGGQHHLNLLAGQEVYVLNISSLSGNKNNFGFLGKDEPSAASVITGFTGNSDEYKLASYLAKLDYNFADKYFLSGSYRRDGSSRFHSDSRWGNFWSIGGAWSLTGEDFLSSIHWLNSLKLRASYGAQGNDNLGSYYQYQDLYSIYNSLGEAGVITSRLPTPGLKWETNLNFNVGLDYTLFGGRINGSVEFYQRKSKDLLFQRPLSPSLGFTAIDDNIGSLQNTGFEIQINTVPVAIGDFRWELGLNLGHYQNEITALPQKEIVVANTSVIGSTKKLTVGSSVYDFFIREWAGINPENGQPLWYKNVYEIDAEGNRIVTSRTTTSVYAEADQYYVDSSLPDLYGGLTNTFRYKGIELSALLAFSIGGKVLDFDQIMISHNGNNIGRTWSKEILERWTPENTQTDVPRLTTDNTNWNSASTRFLYDASYARLRNVNLSYTLPSAWTSKAHLQNVRIYARGENLLTFYAHKGMDPEQAVDGVTFYRFPAQKTVSLGFDLSF